MNICFSSDKKTLKKATLEKVSGFREIFAPLPDKIDVLVFSGDGDITEYLESNIDTCIYDSSYTSKILQLKKLNSAVSCGMKPLDSVTFSSISDDTALVCIRRQIIFGNKTFDPCEFKAPFDSRLGIYYNLVLALLNYVTKNA